MHKCWRQKLWLFEMGRQMCTCSIQLQVIVVVCLPPATTCLLMCVSLIDPLFLRLPPPDRRGLMLLCSFLLNTTNNLLPAHHM